MRRVVLALLLALLPSMAQALDGPALLRKPPISVAGAPRSLVTLVVPVPTELEGAARIQFDVVLSGTVSVVGRLNGEIVPDVGQRPRPVMLTLRVPSDALIGLLDVADVVFTTESGTSVVVPIILRVPGIRSLLFSGVREMRNLEPGDRLELVYRLQNLGNVTEHLDVVLSGTPAWTPRVEEGSRIIVPAYGSQELTIRLRVPPTLAGGSHPLQVTLVRADADSGAAAAAETRTMLRVQQRVARTRGLAFRPYVGVGAASDGVATASGLRIDGPVSERVQVLVDLATPPSTQGLGVIGLSGLGAVRLPFQATVAGPTWNVVAGNASAPLGALTGNTVNGEGATVSLRAAGGEWQAIAARPFGGLGARGRIVGLRHQRAFGDAALTLAASSLEERSGLTFSPSRGLTSLGAEIEHSLADGTFLGGGLAFRRGNDVQSLGYRAAVERRGDLGSFRASFLYAPGGALAFAPARQLVLAEGTRQLSDRLRVVLAGQLTTDGGGALRELSTRQVSVAGDYRLLPWASLNLRLAEMAMRAAATSALAGGFETAQRGVTVGGRATWLGWDADASLRVSQVSRVTELLSGATASESALQRASTVGVSRRWDGAGVMSGSLSLIETGGGVGAPPQLWSSSLRWSELPVGFFGEIFRLEAELRSVRSSLDATRLGARLKVETVLSSGLDVAASIERNPFLVDGVGGSGVIAALKVGLSRDLLGSNRLTTVEGSVFEDLDADGQRDAGERGVPNVVVRYDNYRFESNRRGTFRIPTSLRGRLRVDASTLPAGFVLHPRFALDTLERREIPLVPTGGVTVQLFLQPDAEGRVPDVTLENADVWLRDADGFEWVGQYVGEGRFRFHDIPVGVYEMRTDFARLAEPVRAEETSFRITPGAPVTLTVPLRGRTIRLITPPRQGGGRGAVAPRGGTGRQR